MDETPIKDRPTEPIVKAKAEDAWGIVLIGLAMASIGVLPALRSSQEDWRALGWGVVILGVSLAAVGVLTVVERHLGDD